MATATDSDPSLLVDWDERATAQATLEAAQEQLQSLCASHAGTFVAVERRGRDTIQALQQLQSSTTLIEKIKSAQAVLEQQQQQQSDGDTLADLSEQHRIRRRTLLQHASLLELLELPSLMDACVRSQQYDDALSLAALANTLERRHYQQQQPSSGNNNVITHVVNQLRTRQTDLRRHLLHRLQSHVHMPSCLEVVTALRRLDNITLERQTQANVERTFAAMEVQLQLDFLEARNAWIDSIIPAASDSSSNTTLATSAALMAGKYSEQLLDTIERYRTRIFEVASQFNAIFRAQAKSSDMSVSLLSMWLTRRIDDFLKLLREQLADSIDDAAALRDVWDASIFFATSLGRLGADFSARLAPLFETRMIELVVHPWQDGLAQWQECLNVCVKVGVATPLVSSNNNDDDDLVHKFDDSIPLSQPQPPPRILLTVPPLARLVNAVLTSLNELRRCLLQGLISPLRLELDELLTKAKSELLASEKQVLKPGQPKELRQAMSVLLVMLKDVVDPYLRGSLETAFGQDSGAEKYHGILRNNLKKEEKEIAEEIQETVIYSNTATNDESAATDENVKVDDQPQEIVDDNEDANNVELIDDITEAVNNDNEQDIDDEVTDKVDSKAD